MAFPNDRIAYPNPANTPVALENRLYVVNHPCINDGIWGAGKARSRTRKKYMYVGQFREPGKGDQKPGRERLSEGQIQDYSGSSLVKYTSS
jgi:hypothetical protein